LYKLRNCANPKNLGQLRAIDDYLAAKQKSPGDYLFKGYRGPDKLPYDTPIRSASI